MILFDDTEIFTSGNRGKKIFDLPDCELVLIDQFIDKEASDYYYNTLLEQTKWREYEMELFEKKVTAPRMVSWHEDPDNSEINSAKQEFTSDLSDIRKKVESETSQHFNAVLLNLYRNGNDGVAWHSDHTDKTRIDPVIASVSFGETRMFRLRHKYRKDIPQVEIPLHHGSFLLMAGKTNSFWQHQVPKTAKTILPRINLTFRQVQKSS